MRPLTPAEVTVVRRHLSTRTVSGDDGCILWTGAFSDTGYGNFWTSERYIGAHRAAWYLANGPIPEQRPQLVVCHTCDVRACCNPEHMFLGTRKDNHYDALAKGKIAHHPKTGRMVGGSGRSVPKPIPRNLDKNVCPLILERNR